MPMINSGGRPLAMDGHHIERLEYISRVGILRLGNTVTYLDLSGYSQAPRVYSKIAWGASSG